METAGAELITAGMELETAGADLETAGVELETVGMELETVGMELESAGAELETVGAELETVGCRMSEISKPGCNQITFQLGSNTITTWFAKGSERPQSLVIRSQGLAWFRFRIAVRTDSDHDCNRWLDNIDNRAE